MKCVSRTSKKGKTIILERKVQEIWVNNYNPEWISAWNGNMDIQLCLDFYAICTYLGLISKNCRYTMALMSTLNAHSGYHFPFFPSPEAHDYHHLKFNQCYGILGILDYLHGTDTLFRSSKSYDRHYMLLSSTPARELIPDGDKIHYKKLD